MDLLLLFARLLLAGVFAVAGLAKLVDRPGSRQALRDFGVPAPLAAPGGTLLPLAELIVAALLLPTATAWWGGLGALALLVAFVAGIGYNLARGRTPDCHCFGQLHSAPAGRRTLIRNTALAAVAGVIVWQGPANPGPSMVGWLGGLTGGAWAALVGGVAVLALVVAQGWLLLNLLRQNGRLLLRIEALEVATGTANEETAAQPAHGLPLGTPAPAFQLNGLYGETGTLDALRAATKPVVLVFSDPGCGPCTALLPDLARWQREHAAKLTIALISRGTPEANRAKFAEHGLTQVLFQHNGDVAAAYQVPGTPSAVLVRPDGTIGSPVAPGAEAIATLIARTVTGSSVNGHGAAPARPAALPVGSLAPALTLPDLDGKQVSLTDFGGRATLLLFWNPGCGFCQRMLADLQAWEAEAPPDAPQLLLISTGAVEANRALGLHAPVLLDQGFRTGQQFGATGTPMAVLIDAEGRIASELAAGAPAILELIRNTASSTNGRQAVQV